PLTAVGFLVLSHRRRFPQSVAESSGAKAPATLRQRGEERASTTRQGFASSHDGTPRSDASAAVGPAASGVRGRGFLPAPRPPIRPPPLTATTWLSPPPTTTAPHGPGPPSACIAIANRPV